MTKKLPENFEELRPDEKLRARADNEKRSIISNAWNIGYERMEFLWTLAAITSVAGMVYGAINAPFRNQRIDSTVDRAIEDGQVTEDGYIALEANKEITHNHPAKDLMR